MRRYSLCRRRGQKVTGAICAVEKMPDIHPGGWPIRFSCVFLSASGGSARTRFLLNSSGEATLHPQREEKKAREYAFSCLLS
jgi:hypothetical protein